MFSGGIENSQNDVLNKKTAAFQCKRDFFDPFVANVPILKTPKTFFQGGHKMGTLARNRLMS